MLVLTVTSFNGTPATGPSAQFDELGGSIGRADTNQLVLPDPERSISRVHAQVLFRNGGWVLVDRGSNAVLVNGQTLGNGREAPLRDGDRVQIGGYLLEASMGERTKTIDPFADLFAETTPARRIVTGPPSFPDPLARPTPAAPAAPTRAAPASAPRAPASPASAIPEDWDPFAPDAPAPAFAPPASPAAHAPLVPDLPLTPPAREESLDALFDLGASPAAPLDPLAGAGLGLPPAQPNTAAASDPLQSLLSSAAPVAPSHPDHASELQTPWIAPPLQGASMPPAAPAGRPASPPAPAPMPKGAVLSWEQPSREGRVLNRPGAPQPGAPDAATAFGAERTMVRPVSAAPSSATAFGAPAARPPAPTQAAAGAPSPAAARAPMAAVPAGAAHPAPPAPGASPAGDLLAAFAEGLGMTDLPMRQLGPDEMRLLGQLLREATQGTVELLLSRAALKREMRAEVTVIAARENNPMKFSPTPEVALQYLLGPQKPGFMAPAPAMRDAFNDLRAHQLGMMAGMRAALDGVLKRFDPAVLETRIASKRSGLGGLLPGSRKAQLWELFQDLYSQLSAEAADDFHQLFGKAFLAAYEGYIAQLREGDE
jgi:type VI secretion system FHA domain protein